MLAADSELQNGLRNLQELDPLVSWHLTTFFGNFVIQSNNTVHISTLLEILNLIT